MVVWKMERSIASLFETWKRTAQSTWRTASSQGAANWEGLFTWTDALTHHYLWSEKMSLVVQWSLSR